MPRWLGLRPLRSLCPTQDTRAKPSGYPCRSGVWNSTRLPRASSASWPSSHPCARERVSASAVLWVALVMGLVHIAARAYQTRPISTRNTLLPSVIKDNCCSKVHNFTNRGLLSICETNGSLRRHSLSGSSGCGRSRSLSDRCPRRRIRKWIGCFPVGPPRSTHRGTVLR